MEAAAGTSGRLTPGEVSFHTIITFMEAVSRVRGKGSMKRKLQLVRRFMDEIVVQESGTAFDIWRLVLPQLDSHRGPYMLKHRKLGQCLLMAFGVPESAAAGQAVVHYLNPKSGSGAGRFAVLVKRRLFDQMCGIPDPEPQQERHPKLRDLKVADVNRKLDELAAAGGGREKGALALRWLLQRCTPKMAYYLVQIILKDVPINLGQEYVFREWHPSAKDCYHSCMDARRVFNDLRDPEAAADVYINPGRPASSQLGLALHSAKAVVLAMQQRLKQANGGNQSLQFLIEPKFDGERQQVHLLGPDTPCHYFSRRGFDHGLPSGYGIGKGNGSGHYCMFDPVIRAQVKPQVCILDGEMLVWNKKRRQFEVFGSLRSVCAAIAQGSVSPDYAVECKGFDDTVNTADPEWEPPLLKDLEITYVVWDIIHIDGSNVNTLPLTQRHKLLREVVRDAPPDGYPVGTDGVVRGRVVLLLPGVSLYGFVTPPKICSTVEDVEEAIASAMKQHEEGIVVKQLDSPWHPGDRSGNWVKLKPDYLRKCDLDCLIIGAWWGENARSGQLSEFLLGIAQRPREGSSHPTRWLSFSKVGCGFTVAEQALLHEKLRSNTCEEPPPCYELTGHHKERPHLWIRNPMQSVVLEVHADLRLVRSKVYSSDYSLRFPRFERIRHDKDALTVTGQEELERIVAEKQGYMFREDAKQLGNVGRRPRLARLRQQDKPKRRTLPAALAAVDVSEVQQESSQLEGSCICVLNYDGGYDRHRAEKLVKLMGGSRYLRLSSAQVGCEDGITHVLAGKGAGPGWAAAQKLGCDVLSLSWLERCYEEGERMQPRPSEYLQISGATLQSRQDWDCYGDSFYEEASEEDVAAVLRRMPPNECLSAGAALEGWLEEQGPAFGDQVEDHAPALLQLCDDGGTGNGDHHCIAGGDSNSDEDVLLKAQRQLAQRTQRLTSQQPHPHLSCRLAAAVDAHLAAAGVLDGASMLHGCCIAIVCLPVSEQGAGCGARLAGVAQLKKAVACSSASLAACTASNLRALVAAHGGRLSSKLDLHTTHLLVVLPPAAIVGPAAAAAGGAGVRGEAAAAGEGSGLASAEGAPAAAGVGPVALLAAVSRQCGGGTAVACLRQRLEAGKLAVLSSRWLEASCEAVEESCGTALLPLGESAYRLPLVGGSLADFASWPWYLFTPSPPAATIAAEVAPAPQPTAVTSSAAATSAPAAALGGAGAKPGGVTQAAPQPQPSAPPHLLAAKLAGRNSARGRDAQVRATRARMAAPGQAAPSAVPVAVPYGRPAPAAAEAGGEAVAPPRCQASGSSAAAACPSVSNPGAPSAAAAAWAPPSLAMLGLAAPTPSVPSNATTAAGAAGVRGAAVKRCLSDPPAAQKRSRREWGTAAAPPLKGGAGAWRPAAAAAVEAAAGSSFFRGSSNNASQVAPVHAAPCTTADANLFRALFGDVGGGGASHGANDSGGGSALALQQPAMGVQRPAQVPSDTLELRPPTMLAQQARASSRTEPHGAAAVTGTSSGTAAPGGVGGVFLPPAGHAPPLRQSQSAPPAFSSMEWLRLPLRDKVLRCQTSQYED